MRTPIQILGLFLLFFQPLVAPVASAQTNGEYDDLGPGLFALFEIEFTGDNPETGEFVCELFFEQTPLTAANFVGLAEGGQRWIHPATGVIHEDTPFYDGLIFHRVVENFVIQAGDPLETGAGGPGYTFGDEILPELASDKKGILAMANNGPRTNGSQFFITLEDDLEFEGEHTVFGEVVRGLDVVEAIGAVPTGKDQEEEENGEEIPDDRPIDDVVIERVSLIRNGPAAEAFDADSAELPQPVTLPKTELLKDGDRFYLRFDHRYYNDYRVFTSPDLENWEYAGNVFPTVELGQPPDPHRTNITNLTTGKPRLFFRTIRVRYPDSAFVGFPNRTYELNIESFHPDYVMIVQHVFFNGRDLYVYETNPGTPVTTSGRLLPREGKPYNNGNARLLLDTDVTFDLTFVFDDEHSGTFTGTRHEQGEDPEEMFGTFTVTENE